MDWSSIGRNIRDYRVENGMRQEDLAEATGLSANYIGMVERGEKTPSLETFVALLNALHGQAVHAGRKGGPPARRRAGAHLCGGGRAGAARRSLNPTKRKSGCGFRSRFCLGSAF